MNLHELTRTYGLRLLDLGVPNLAFPKITGLILGQVGSWVWSYCESKCAWWNEVYWNLWASSIPWTYIWTSLLLRWNPLDLHYRLFMVRSCINLHHQRSVLFTALLCGELEQVAIVESEDTKNWINMSLSRKNGTAAASWARVQDIQDIQDMRHFDISGRPKAEGFPGWCE